jgi:hypothetical protein
MQRFHVARDLCASNNLEVFGGHDIAPEPIGAVKTLAPLGAPLPRAASRLGFFSVRQIFSRTPFLSICGVFRGVDLGKKPCF